jgi:hypothetical protein
MGFNIFSKKFMVDILPAGKELRPNNAPALNSAVHCVQ